jgi:hypothetical protein
MLAVLALVFGILSGVRWPNLWSMTHLLFDYAIGFTKRGLVGQFLSYVLADPISYLTLAVLSFCIFTLWVFLLFIGLRGIAKVDYRIWLVAAVVFVSPGFVFLVHEIGYLDHLGLVVVFACVMMPANLVGLLGRVLLCVLMVLSHETFFLSFFPVVALEFLVRSTLRGNRAALASTVLLVGVAAALTVWMGQSSLPPEKEAIYASHVAERARDFSIRPDAIKLQFRDGGDNLAIMAKIWQREKRWGLVLVGTVFLLPLPIGFALTSLGMIRRTPLPDRERVLISLGIGAASFCPLILNVVAWDIWRFFALTQISAFLVLIVVAERCRVALVPERCVFFAGYVLVVVAVIGAATAMPLFDEYTVSKPPYLSRLLDLHSILAGEAPWLRIPTRY